MARKKEQTSEGTPAWMATYSDMVTLLLTFFILLFSLSTVDKNRFSEVAASLASSIINLKGGEAILKYNGNSIIALDFSSIQDKGEKEKEKEKYLESAEDMVVDAEQKIADQKLDDAKERIRDTIDEEGLSDKVQIIEEKNYLLISLGSEVFFDSGSADIRPEGKTLLSALAKTLQGIDNEIMVSGHTDNVPMHNEKFRSNWELSTARATNVVTYLIETEGLNPGLFTATGNGEYRPVGDNNTPEGRQKNRRIEIKILK